LEVTRVAEGGRTPESDEEELAILNKDAMLRIAQSDAERWDGYAKEDETKH
jgi:hypothetical protein